MKIKKSKVNILDCSFSKEFSRYSEDNCKCFNNHLRSTGRNANFIAQSVSTLAAALRFLFSLSIQCRDFRPTTSKREVRENQWRNKGARRVLFDIFSRSTVGHEPASVHFTTATVKMRPESKWRRTQLSSDARINPVNIKWNKNQLRPTRWLYQLFITTAEWIWRAPSRRYWTSVRRAASCSWPTESWRTSPSTTENSTSRTRCLQVRVAPCAKNGEWLSGTGQRIFYRRTCFLALAES